MLYFLEHFWSQFHHRVSISMSFSIYLFGAHLSTRNSMRRGESPVRFKRAGDTPRLARTVLKLAYKWGPTIRHTHMVSVTIHWCFVVQTVGSSFTRRRDLDVSKWAYLLANMFAIDAFFRQHVKRYYMLICATEKWTEKKVGE